MARKSAMLGVDIGSHSIKVVEMTLRKGVPVITGAVIEEFQGDSIDEIQQTITDVVSKFNVKRCVLGVSGRTVCVRYVPITAANEEDLQKALVFEADKYIPFEVNEVYIDGKNITPFPDNGEADEVRAMLACARKETVERAHNNASACGLIPAVVDIEAFALGNAYEAQRIVSESDEEKVVAVVDMGALKTTVNIVKDGISYFSREIYVGGGDFLNGVETRLGLEGEMARQLMQEPGPDAEQIDDIISSVFEEVGSEVKMAIDYFENQYEGEEVEEVLVSGGGALARRVMDLFMVTLEKKVLRWDPLSSFKVENVDLDDFGEHRTQFAVAVGLAARVLEV